MLRKRGMQINDGAKATEYLHRIGYYRLSAYWHPMRQRCAESGSVMNDFVAGTTFKQATDLYTFDGRLRLIMLDALERIEVSLRTETALCLGQKSPCAHRDFKSFSAFFQESERRGRATRHQEWLSRLDAKAVKSKDKFAEHFRTKYPNENMPIWVAVELLDFGPLSHLIGGMKNTDLISIGRNYGALKPPQIKSWAHALSFTRNVCAHHSRLWNKPLVNQPSLTSDNVPEMLRHVATQPAHETLPSPVTRLYSVACIAKYMLGYANPRTSWRDRFVSHMDTFPETNRLNLSSAGFPPDWKAKDLWK